MTNTDGERVVSSALGSHMGPPIRALPAVLLKPALNLGDVWVGGSTRRFLDVVLGHFPHLRTHPSLFSPRKLHSGMKTYGCELCGKRFLDSLRLRMHLLAHSGGLGGGAGLGMRGHSVCPPRDAEAAQLTRLRYSRHVQSRLHPFPGQHIANLFSGAQ